MLAFSIMGILPEETSYAHYRWSSSQPVLQTSMQAAASAKQAIVPKTLKNTNTEELIVDSPAVFAEIKTRYTNASGALYLRSELRPICACESSWEGTKHGEPRQYENGKVLRGYVTPEDIGMCQISLTWHGDRAERLGADVFTTEGNIAYSNYLYEIEGSTPWYKSQFCWDK